MKKVLILLTVLFAFTTTVAVADSFSMKMKDAGFRWTQDMDNLDNFWSGDQDTNGLRLFTTAYVGSKSHEVTMMYNRQQMSGPWDLFEGNDQHLENVAVEYRYNFD